MNLGNGIIKMEQGFYHAQRGYWQTTGDVPQSVIDGYPSGTVTVPLKPAADYEWTGSQWVYAAPDPAIILADTRDASAITRAEFCNALADHGIITDAEAISAARGDWPVSMAGFLDFLDAGQSRDVQIEWAACATVLRMHPFVLTLGSWLDLTANQLDELFGIGPAA
jgi:hypothetical protein